ncbi:hypothetical protein CFRS1_v001505 [Colletotrichum fructicola]|nr:hypothetical protein CFRS1_v001505 [Colletotrichum fructicola]
MPAIAPTLRPEEGSSGLSVDVSAGAVAAAVANPSLVLVAPWLAELIVVVAVAAAAVVVVVVKTWPTALPTVAAGSLKTAVEVLQHRVFSRSDSQQYSASAPYPCRSHSHTWTPLLRKS